MTADLPRLLLVEDDPISLEFLSEALEGVPARLDLAEDIASATWLAREFPHALWLVDAHLPDGTGLDCLRALRACADTPAIAVTATTARDELDALCAGGFLEVMVKPVSVAQAQATVRRLLGLPAGGVREPRHEPKLPAWDEVQALAAIGGKPEALARLRRLFLDELPGLREQWRLARDSGDAVAMRAILHKLKASCGFVGALRMGRAVDELSRHPLDAVLVADLEDAAADVLQAAGTSP